jgi:hypothetical protein
MAYDVDTKISEPELKVWHAVAVYQSTHGVSPTLGELAAMCGWKATSTVARHLEALELKGLVRRDRAMSRSIQLIKEPPTVPTPAAAGLSSPYPTTRPLESSKADYLSPDAKVVLTVLPSEECLELPLTTQVILGRIESTGGGDDIFDLARFDAYKLGVSRRHCMLQRHGTYLLVTDLGSSNGTFLNGKRILPSQHHIVADGDDLVLGALHFIVKFANDGSVPTPPSTPVAPDTASS